MQHKRAKFQNKIKSSTVVQLGQNYYGENKQRIIHGRAEIWNLSSSVHIDIERVSAANE